MDFDNEKSYMVIETDGPVPNQVALRSGRMAQEGQVIRGDSILLFKVQGQPLLDEGRIEPMVIEKRGSKKLVPLSEKTNGKKIGKGGK